MIMVDQLWLCLVIREECMPDDHQFQENWRPISSVVVTSFPHTSYARSEKESRHLYHIADVRQGVFDKLKGEDDNIKSDPSPRAPRLASAVLSTALLGTLSIPRDWPKHWSLNFLELFREAIGDVTEKYSDFQQAFDASMAPDAERINIEKRRKEVRLGVEIADIIDELHMLRQIFETQSNVLEKGCDDTSNIVYLKSYRDEMSRIRDKIINEYLLQVERMMRDSERIQRSLLDLLDLQQKEESIYEAQYANRQALFAAKQALSSQSQADTTEAQSQILFMFTFVTIIFLPLSFFTSFFGMNIDDGKGATQNYDRPHVNNVMGGISGPVIGLLLIGAVIWHIAGTRGAARKRIKELAELRLHGNLPQGLIGPGDPGYSEMLAMCEKLSMTEAKKSELPVILPARREATLAATERPLDDGRVTRRNTSKQSDENV
jgi:CorA-like Mg2+ transporter protein